METSQYRVDLDADEPSRWERFGQPSQQRARTGAELNDDTRLVGRSLGEVIHDRVKELGPTFEVVIAHRLPSREQLLRRIVVLRPDPGCV